MKIKNHKIIECTTTELYKVWLKKWCTFLPFDEYMEKCKKLGVKVKEG